MLNAGKELIERHAHWLSPKWMGADGTWEMVVQSWIVIVDRWDCRRPDHRRVAANDGVFENSVLPVVHAGLAELVPDLARPRDRAGAGSYAGPCGSPSRLTPAHFAAPHAGYLHETDGVRTFEPLA